MIRKLHTLIVHVCLFHVVKVMTDILLPNFSWGNRVRGYLVGQFFKKKGASFLLAPGYTINMAKNIEVGDNVYIAHDVWINASGGLKIEDGVIISPKVVIATTKHQYIDGAVSLGMSEASPIVIERGAWVVSGTVVTKGVRIGEGSIVGACSVVTKDIRSFWFSAGQPAKEIRQLTETKPTEGCEVKTIEVSTND